MAVPHSRLVLSGTNAGGDIWSTGLTLVGDQDASVADWTAWLAANATAIANTFNGGTHPWGTCASSGTSLKKLSTYSYIGGLPPADRQAEFTYTTPKTGAGSAAVPYECAVVASLLTGFPGRKNRGRMYLPGDGAVLTAHQMSSADCVTIASGIVDLIDVIQAAPAPSGTGNLLVVVTGKSPGSAANLVTQVRVDSKTDVQRRRQNKVAASSTSIQNV